MPRALLAFCLLPLLSVSSPASAAPKKKKEAPAAPAPAPANPLEADLGKLKFGMTVEEVKSAYLEKLDAVYDAKLKGVRDTIKADAILAEKKKERGLFEGSYKSFDTKTDVGRWNVSVIGAEISVGTSESMLIIRDERSQRYFFFENGKFYKLFVAYDADYLGDLSFDDFSDKIASKHGTPAGNHHREPGPGEVGTARRLVATSWSDASASLWVEDKRDLYGSVVLVYTSPTGREIDRIKLLTPPKTTSKYGVDDDMIEGLGGRREDPAPAPVTKEETKKKDSKKKDSKKKTIDPLEGLGL